MSTTSILPELPQRAQVADDAGRFTRETVGWLYKLQSHQPLVEVDTSGGPVTLALPPAGNNATTGQSAQNQELIYIKTTADGNVATITGAAQGAQTLTAQYDKLRFKSNGTTWYMV